MCVCVFTISRLGVPVGDQGPSGIAPAFFGVEAPPAGGQTAQTAPGSRSPEKKGGAHPYVHLEAGV